MLNFESIRRTAIKLGKEALERGLAAAAQGKELGEKAQASIKENVLEDQRFISLKDKVLAKIGKAKEAAEDVAEDTKESAENAVEQVKEIIKERRA